MFKFYPRVRLCSTPGTLASGSPDLKILKASGCCSSALEDRRPSRTPRLRSLIGASNAHGTSGISCLTYSHVYSSQAQVMEQKQALGLYSTAGSAVFVANEITP